MLNNYKLFHNKKYSNIFVNGGISNLSTFKTIFSFYKVNIRIIGKIFRWYFFKRKIRFIINRNHVNILYFNRDFKIFKLSQGKYNSDLLTLCRVNINKLHYFISNSRNLSIFTKRGVFINKHFNNKLGKISSYV